jgi:2-polyprenyl-6-methoxyphenol hydroxylase-like FAD-dependent oxidoreductase
VHTRGEKRAITGRFAIGADGGNSFVRQAPGIAHEPLGFDQDWLVIDGREKRLRAGLPAMRHHLFEPEQPGETLRWDPTTDGGRS